MDKKSEWDYALRLRGYTPKTIPVARLASYLKDWASLLGESNAPMFRGIVNGSLVIRASIDPVKKPEVRQRLAAAKERTDPTAAKLIDNLNSMMARDAVMGTVIDSAGQVVLDFKQKKTELPEAREYVVPDSGVVDGVVVGIQGVDDTVHVRIQEASGASFSVALRDLAMARKFAAHFRSDPIRVHVHGTWKRTAAGIWEPLNLVTDGFEELDQSSVSETMNQLREIPKNGWSDVTDPIGFWKDLRGAE